MSIKTIIVDVDDTIVDYTTAFFNYHGHTNIRAGVYENFVAYLNSLDSDVQYGVPCVAKMVDEFNQSPEFARLTPLEHAREALHELRRRMYSLHVITSCGTHERTAQYREQNLLSEFGNIFDDITLLPAMAPKVERLKQYDPATTLLVEDNVANYQAARELGMHSILISHQFTPAPDDAFINDDWREIFENIINL